MNVPAMPTFRTALLAAAALLLTACGSDSPEQAPAPVDPASPEAPIAVSLVLNWFPEAEHGGYYAALVHGYYEEAGLEVEILPGGVDVPVVPMVDTGKVDFGVTNADNVLLGRAQGAEIVALMAPLQTSPRSLIVRDDSPIRSFDDLRNVTVAMSPKATYSTFLRRTLPLEGVTVVPYPGNVAPLLTGQVDALQAYIISEPFVAEQQGTPVRNLLVADLGFNPYTSLLTTTEATLAERPEMVQAMVTASLRGWEHYMRDPEETNAYIHQQNPQMGPEILAYGAEKMNQLVFPGNMPPEQLGAMESDRWQTLASQLVDIDVLDEEEAAAEKVRDAFQTEMLEEAR